MNKKLTVVVVGIVVVITVILGILLQSVFGNNQKNGTLQIVYNNLPDQNGLVVSVNHKLLTGQSIYQEPLASGQYTLSVSKSGYGAISRIFSITSAQTTIININLKLSAKPSAGDLTQIFTTIIGGTASAILSSQLPYGTTAVNTNYFDNQTWAIVTINIKNSFGIAYFVDRYDTAMQRWVLVTSPNDDFNSSDLKTMPLDVQQYIKNNYYVNNG